MSRIAAVWEEMTNRIAGKDETSVRRKVALVAIPIVAIMLLVTLAAWMGFKLDAAIIKDLPAWVKGLLPMAPYIVVAATLFLTWHFAAAWEHLKGPIISMGKIVPDKYFEAFEFRLENRGSGQVLAHPYAVELQDRKGVRIPRIDDEIKLHCRGYHEVGKEVMAGKADGTENKPTREADKLEGRIRLFGKRHVMVAFLRVIKGGDQNEAMLQLLTPAASPNFGTMPLVADRPTLLKNQEKVYLLIRVDFFNDKDEFLISKTRRVAIIPHAKSPLLYRVRPAKWWE